MLLKTFIMARQAGHYIRDERVQVEDSILLLKTITVARPAGHCIREEVTSSGRYFVVNNKILLNPTTKLLKSSI